VVDVCPTTGTVFESDSFKKLYPNGFETKNERLEK
jgi:hypothetical protein